jgi:hypothetical protein
MCCHLGEIPDFKPYNQWCVACSSHQRCDRYDTRPTPCRQFECYFLTSDLGEAWRPNQCGLVLSVHADPERLTILVDPEKPLRWRESPYIEQILQWSLQCAVSIMVGNAAFAVYPDRIETLGEVGEDETIVTTELHYAQSGRRFLSKRMKKLDVAAYLAQQTQTAP